MPVGNSCYDVQVDIPAPLQKEMNAFLQNVEKHRDIDMYGEAICSSIAKVNEHRKRRAFFLGFSHSPVDFINGLFASQSRDLKMVAGQGSRNAEKKRRSDFYNQPCLNDDSLAMSLPYLKSKDVGVISASPLSMGLMTDQGPPNWHPAPEILKKASASAAALCGSKGKSISKLALQFAMNNPEIATTVVGMCSVEQVHRNIQAVTDNSFAHDEQTLEEVETLFETSEEHDLA